MTTSDDSDNDELGLLLTALRPHKRRRSVLDSDSDDCDFDWNRHLHWHECEREWGGVVLESKLNPTPPSSVLDSPRSPSLSDNGSSHSVLCHRHCCPSCVLCSDSDSDNDNGLCSRGTDTPSQTRQLHWHGYGLQRRSNSTFSSYGHQSLELRTLRCTGDSAKYYSDSYCGKVTPCPNIGHPRSANARPSHGSVTRRYCRLQASCARCSAAKLHWHGAAKTPTPTPETPVPEEVAAEKAEPRSDTVELVEHELATRRSRLEARIATTAAPELRGRGAAPQPEKSAFETDFGVGSPEKWSMLDLM